MSSTQQLQAVAKRLEKMLETALAQLKVEQGLRREGEGRLVELELSLVNAEHNLRSAEERFANILTEKDARIGELEEKVKVLEGLLQEKEQELLDSRDGFQEPGHFESLQESAERFEMLLKNLKTAD